MSIAPQFNHNYDKPLLKRVRDLIASTINPESRLKPLLSLITQECGTELTALFLKKDDKSLSLFAQIGPKANALNNRTLQVGEGLIGSIAAHALPQIIPSTNASDVFIGLPIIIHAEVKAVLALQFPPQFHPHIDDFEALETCASFISETLAQCHFTESPIPLFKDSKDKLTGKKIVGGLAIGHIVKHQSSFAVQEVKAPVAFLEKQRLDKALIDLKDNLTQHAENVSYPDMLNVYHLILNDKKWLKSLYESMDSGLTAEAALYKSIHETSYKLTQGDNQHALEKQTEIEALFYQLGYFLTSDLPPKIEIKPGTILAASSLSLTEILNYERQHLVGLLLDEGAANSHLAIVAKSMDLPTLSGITGLIHYLQDGEKVIIDADAGHCLINPQPETVKKYKERISSSAATKPIKGPSVSKDGQILKLMINAGFEEDVIDLDKKGIDGVGLYRTEIPFMSHKTFPSLFEQQNLYTRIFNNLGNTPITFRTLDLGADKFTPYLKKMTSGSNPALGWRSSRIMLDEPTFLHQQIKALLSAGHNKKFSIMFPMITTTLEFSKLKHIIDQELAESPQPPKIKIGAMIEVPNLIYELDSLLPLVDFVSIGSNDLFQFMYASDRNAAENDHRYDPLSSSFLNTIKTINDQCIKYNKPLSVCGEMASNPLEALTLIGLGITELSIAKSNYQVIKKMVKNTSIEKLKTFLKPLLSHKESNIREKIGQFAQDHAILEK